MPCQNLVMTVFHVPHLAMTVLYVPHDCLICATGRRDIRGGVSTSVHLCQVSAQVEAETRRVRWVHPISTCIPSDRTFKRTDGGVREKYGWWREGHIERNNDCLHPRLLPRNLIALEILHVFLKFSLRQSLRASGSRDAAGPLGNPYTQNPEP